MHLVVEAEGRLCRLVQELLCRIGCLQFHLLSQGERKKSFSLSAIFLSILYENGVHFLRDKIVLGRVFLIQNRVEFFSLRDLVPISFVWLEVGLNVAFFDGAVRRVLFYFSAS